MNSISQWFISEFVPAFGRTLVHSLWQGVAAAVLAGIIIGITRKAPAVKRYNGLVAVYALFTITVCISFFYELGSSAAVAATQPAPATQPSAILVIENSVAANQVAEQSLMSNIRSFVNQHAMLLVGLWALLFIAQLTRMALGLRYVQTVKKEGISAVPVEWTAWIDEMSFRLGIRQIVVLLQSQKIKVPVALGILKPVVLVPVGLLTQLTAQQVEAVLLHELAHIRRKDYLVNLVQSFADAVFFFNPAVRWISARIREERETCCDDVVMQHTTNKKDYVEALVSFSQMPLSSSYAMAIGSNKNHLLNRVKTIITRENSRLTAREQATLMLGMVVMIAFVALAFKPKEKEIKKEPFIEKQLAAETKNIASSNSTEPLKKTIKPILPKQVADTVPTPSTKRTEPIKWKSLNSSINDDGEGKTLQVIATEADGTVYKLRKIDNEIVLLSVNGTEIPKANYPQYYSIIDAMEQARKKGMADAVKKQEQQKKMLQQKQESMQQQQIALQKKNEVLQQQNVLLKKNEVLQQQQSTLDLKMQWLRADSLKRLHNLIENEQKKQNYNQNLQYHNEKKKLFNQDKSSHHSDATLSAIIADLLANKLAENNTKLSFTLKAKGLVVNGKKIDKELFEIFKKKYIKSSGDSYTYMRDGGTTKTNINIE